MLTGSLTSWIALTCHSKTFGWPDPIYGDLVNWASQEWSRSCSSFPVASAVVLNVFLCDDIALVIVDVMRCLWTVTSSQLKLLLETFSAAVSDVWRVLVSVFSPLMFIYGFLAYWCIGRSPAHFMPDRQGLLLAVPLLCLQIDFSSISYWIDLCNHASIVKLVQNRVLSQTRCCPLLLGFAFQTPTRGFAPGPHWGTSPDPHSCSPTLNDLATYDEDRPLVRVSALCALTLMVGQHKRTYGS